MKINANIEPINGQKPAPKRLKPTGNVNRASKANALKRDTPAKNTNRSSKSLRRDNPGEGNRKYVDLGIIGDAVASYVTKLTGHKITAGDIKIKYMSPNADAICFCTKQFRFYDIKRNHPELTPLYFYSGSDRKVVKMGNDLGTIEYAVDALNKAGATMVPIQDLLVH